MLKIPLKLALGDFFPILIDMKRLSGMLQEQRGAALIEGLASMTALLMFLVIALFVGTAYYNTSVMNNATQNMALGVHTQMRLCNVQGGLCTQAAGQSDRIAKDITTQTYKSLALVSPDTNQSWTTLDCVPPGGNEHPAPQGIAAADWPASSGWGYTQVKMRAPAQTVFLPEAAGLVYGSNAISFAYATPGASPAFRPSVCDSTAKVTP